MRYRVFQVHLRDSLHAISVLVDSAHPLPALVSEEHVCIPVVWLGSHFKGPLFGTETPMHVCVRVIPAYSLLVGCLIHTKVLGEVLLRQKGTVILVNTLRRC